MYHKVGMIGVGNNSSLHKGLSWKREDSQKGKSVALGHND